MLVKSALGTVIASCALFLASTVNAGLLQLPPNRDATVYQTGPCNQCVQDACRSCNYNDQPELLVSSQLRVQSNVLLNFNIPPVNYGCYLLLPAPNTGTSSVGSATQLTVYPAATSNWQENTVTGENAPTRGNAVASRIINPTTYQVIDVSSICQNSTTGSNVDVSLYLGINDNSYVRYNSLNNGGKISLFVNQGS
ncbi:hypothetical protein H4219_001624 [Mycoemilia scoparia]|uniref:Carbohydrate-binding module family 96 domain-containing protein n=1 Tax=Mycoemilia scoparia TaxID=417184 RepID=A0A9W8A4C6_9FUNG|nr:hypothetical protein H4219_001624 [Mycoemilia scoparia]